MIEKILMGGITNYSKLAVCGCVCICHEWDPPYYLEGYTDGMWDIKVDCEGE